MRPIELLKIPCFAAIIFAGSVVYGLPELELDWGKYNASDIPDLTDVKVYRNVRYGAPPTDDRRFKASQFPHKGFDSTKDEPADCIAVSMKALREGKCDTAIKQHFSLAFGYNEELKQAEDCLFLDIYVPSDLESFTEPLPVIVWFYGGAYLFGSKSNDRTQGMFYSGVGAVRAALESPGRKGVIFVAGNYRLGALGWLSGSYVEKYGTPNAGLTDQRLILEFVHRYISKLKGDPSNVSAWGESAGGGSILHHLVARNDDGSLRDPLFQKAIVQSPAYQWRWDHSPSGSLDKEYLKFAVAADCPDGSFKCLQNAPIRKIKDAVDLMVCDQHKDGIFPFGPAVDGKLIKEIPAYALGKPGSYWNDLKSIISSHVATEAATFTQNLTINNASEVTRLMGLTFPQPIVDHVKKSRLYFNIGAFCKPLLKCRKCYTKIVQDSMFMTNTRAVYQAYKGRCYMLNYRWPAKIYAKHGTDLLFTFLYKEIDLDKLVKSIHPEWNSTLTKFNLTGKYGEKVKEASKAFQRYFVSHAISGDPEALKDQEAPLWPFTKGDEKLKDGVMTVKGVLKANASVLKYFTVGKHADEDTTLTMFKFWWDVLDKIHKSASSKLNKAADPEEGDGQRDEL
ncbi:hypothetical protein TWF481_006059 [Arthrobotrys musiformis]|uniref:Carboxylesterase type B domain-containing protein n=1 Tax=Arthrobotrys musiformis TaxID=47236 RepID=A0AAV9WFL9_9PEZI